jgi:hypothetical protein
MLSAAADRHANGFDNYRTSHDKLHVARVSRRQRYRWPFANVSEICPAWFDV